jgi:hypothetical protein
MELDSAFAPADSRVAAKVLDGELIVINLDTGYYYASTGTGVAIWQQIEAGASLRQVIVTLVSQYDVTAERAERDARAFVEKLALETLLIPAAAGANPMSPGERTDGKLPYAAPELVKYDDMAEQFAMDPPLVAKSRA